MEIGGEGGRKEGRVEETHTHEKEEEEGKRSLVAERGKKSFFWLRILLLLPILFPPFRDLGVLGGRSPPTNFPHNSNILFSRPPFLARFSGLRRRVAPFLSFSLPSPDRARA